MIWDLDGTLIDSSAYHWEAWQAVMAEERFVLTYEQYVSDFGKRNDEILRGRLRADLPESEILRISLAKEARYRELVRSKGLELLPGVLDWLRQLKADRWLQAIATSSPRGNLDAVFVAVEIEKYFEAVISSEEVRSGKPNPDVFLAAAGKLGVSPEHCIVVEDAPAGIEAARRAGMRSVGVRTTHPDLQAEWVVGNLSELPADFFLTVLQQSGN